jgi:hypothetical protein
MRGATPPLLHTCLTYSRVHTYSSLTFCSVQHMLRLTLPHAHKQGLSCQLIRHCDNPYQAVITVCRVNILELPVMMPPVSLERDLQPPAPPPPPIFSTFLTIFETSILSWALSRVTSTFFTLLLLNSVWLCWRQTWQKPSPSCFHIVTLYFDYICILNYLLYIYIHTHIRFSRGTVCLNYPGFHPCGPWIARIRHNGWCTCML